MKKDISQISTYQSGVMQSTAHRVLMRIKTDFLVNYDLTSAQWFVIGHAYDAGDKGIRLKDLQAILDTSMPFITNLVNLLESKGILLKTSDTEDNRVKSVKLNQSYYATVDEIESKLRDELRSKLYLEDHITREELSTYIRVLYKIAQSQK